MNRQAARRHRRYFAILGALAEYGPLNATALCDLLHRAPGTVYPDLVGLEVSGRVVAEWLLTPAGQPRRRLYRLPTASERANSETRGAA